MLLVGESPTLVLDDDWRLQVATALVVMGFAADEFLSLAPPASLAEMEPLLQRIGRDIHTVVELTIQAIDNIDADTMDRAGFYMERVGDDARALGEILTNHC